MANQFYLTLTCKPYVKRYLEINFGNPVSLQSDLYLLNLLRRYLREESDRKKKRLKFEKRKEHYPPADPVMIARDLPPKITADPDAKLPLKRYSEKIDIIITEWDFYHYGWEISDMDAIHFCKELENRAKLMMRMYVGINLGLTGSIKTSILAFQSRIGFSEDVWPYDSIKKDFYRNGTPSRIDFETEIKRKIDHLFMRTLSENGTITKSLLKQHEIDIQTEK